MKSPLHLAVELCDDRVEEAAGRPVPAWHWGPALFGYSLTELENALAQPRYDAWLRRYCDHYVRHSPKVDQSDTAAPGLITYPMWQRTGDAGYHALTEMVVAYVRSEPRDVGGVTNHLGHSAIGRLYPRSAWVDSLMMAGVFPAWYGREQQDPELIDLAAAQPAAFADLLFHPHDHLWSHSWWQRTGRRYPGRGIYWARGNAWVVAALPRILEHIGPHPQRQRIVELWQQTSDRLLALQRPDGTWDTLLGSRRRTYRELSATALIAAGWFHGRRLGIASGRHADAARLALRAVVASLELVDGRWMMPEISGPTIPLPVAPALGYRLVPRGVNHPYGVAALVLAAIGDARF